MTVTLFVFIIMIFLMMIKSESYNCREENKQFVIDNVLTLSIRRAGDFDREEP